jgi:periplasmic protein TonB
VKSTHVIISLVGHILLLLFMGFTAAALRSDEGPTPGTIRVSFGELPRPGEQGEGPETVAVEALPTEPEPEPELEIDPEPEPEPEPLLDDPPLPSDEEPVILEDAPLEEESTPPPPPAPELPAVKPVSHLDTEPEPEPETEPQPEPTLDDLPPLTEPESRSELHALDEADRAEEETADPQPSPQAGAKPEQPRGASVKANGSAGAGDAYLGLVQSKIGRRWHPSAASTAGRPSLEAVVSFRIGSRGQVLTPELFKSSGLSIFDRSALRAVMESNPLPPPPTRFRDAGLDIQFTFTYRR